MLDEVVERAEEVRDRTMTMTRRRTDTTGARFRDREPRAFI
jgi:hypothetical protein